MLRTQFPNARLDRNLHALTHLPAETEVVAATLPWPEEADDDAKARAVVEQPWLPASRAAAAEELPVSLLRWATAAVPGTSFRLLFHHRPLVFQFFASPRLSRNAESESGDLSVSEFFPKPVTALRSIRGGP